MVEREEEVEVREGETGGVAVLDFDMLCAAVAAAAPAKVVQLAEEGEERWGLGHVQRMWEGELLADYLDDRRIAIEATW